LDANYTVRLVGVKVLGEGLGNKEEGLIACSTLAGWTATSLLTRRTGVYYFPPWSLPHAHR